MFIRAIAVWLIIILAESIHGTLRMFLLAPLMGDFPARRISFFTGMLLIFSIAYLFIRWIKAQSTKSLLEVGLLWMVLTTAFEFGLGYSMGYAQERMLEDYDVGRGGLMGFGLLFMVFTPLLAMKLHKRVKHKKVLSVMY